MTEQMPTEVGDLSIDREAHLAPWALRSCESSGREYLEPEHPYRSVFQRDRDRILHSAAFRRLSGKTQVFTGNMGDYHRTRLTHTMEVASIARTIGRSVRLNEDLIEALALLHDIGHPPFGHAGEDALNECLAPDGGFSHNQFALTLVRELERPYPRFHGLNLTREVLQSQQMRTQKQAVAGTLLEAQVVDAADSMTYSAHDVDDAVKLGLLDIEQLLEIDLVRECHARVTGRFGPLTGEMLRRTLVHELIEMQVSDVLRTSCDALENAAFPDADAASRAAIIVQPSADFSARAKQLEQFLFARVYRHPTVIASRSQSQDRLRQLFDYYTQYVDRLPVNFRKRVDQVGVRRSVADYLAGMTDHYCWREFEQIK